MDKVYKDKKEATRALTDYMISEGIEKLEYRIEEVTDGYKVLIIDEVHSDEKPLKPCNK